MAYARTHGELAALLTGKGAPRAHDLASEVLALMRRCGWQWRYREPVPERGHRGDPTTNEAYQAAKAELARIREASQREDTTR